MFNGVDMKPFKDYLDELNVPLFKGGANPEVYCDMDGVLVNLYKGIHKVIKNTNPDQDQMNAFFSSDAGTSTAFWATLPWQRDGKALWKQLQRYDTHILSACPSVCGDDAAVIKGKKMWCKTNLGIHPSRIHVVQRREKKDFAKEWESSKAGPAVILVDDNRKTCAEWESAGGIAIYHTVSSKSIKQLKRHLDDG